MNYANEYGYSDVNPFEIVRRVSDKTLEIRAMKAVRDDSVKLEFHVGGFSAHCSNQRQQKWFITSNEQKDVIDANFDVEAKSIDAIDDFVGFGMDLLQIQKYAVLTEDGAPILYDESSEPASEKINAMAASCCGITEI